MTATVEDSGVCKKTLTITVDKNVIQGKLDENYNDLQKWVNLPGFRQGKAPLAMIKKKYKDNVEQEVRQTLVVDALRNAIEEHKLEAIGDPTVQDLKWDAEKELTFKAVVFLKPEFTLGDYKDIKVEISSPEATEQEVADTLDDLRRQSSPLADKPEGAKVEEEDTLLATLEMAVDGTVERTVPEIHVRKNASAIFGIPIDNLFGKFKNKKKGDTVAVDAKIPDTFAEEKFRGKNATFKITINALKFHDLKPMAEWVKDMGFETEDDVRKELAGRIQHTKYHRLEGEANQKVIDWLLERNNFELPDELIQRQANQVMAREIINMQRSGYPEEAIKQALEVMKTEKKDSVARSFKSYFILDAIAKKEKIFVTETEVETAVAGMAHQHNVPPKELYERLEHEGQLNELRHSLRESKVLEMLRKKAGVDLGAHDEHHHH